MTESANSHSPSPSSPENTGRSGRPSDADDPAGPPITPEEWRRLRVPFSRDAYVVESRATGRSSPSAKAGSSSPTRFCRRWRRSRSRPRVRPTAKRRTSRFRRLHRLPHPTGAQREPPRTVGVHPAAYFRPKSHRTEQRHLPNLSGKTGIRSRAPSFRRAAPFEEIRPLKDAPEQWQSKIGSIHSKLRACRSPSVLTPGRRPAPTPKRRSPGRAGR